MLKLLTFLVVASCHSLAKTVTYNWSIGWVTKAPDGFSRPVIGINGAWPCPPIEASVGDQIVVNVVNKLGNETTGLHFHGITQKGTNFMDGPTSATQCPIPPGASFTYSFKVDDPGTYWYHSHNMGQYPDGLRGPLIVYDSNDPCRGKFDEELVLTVSDWYHDQVPTLLPQMLTPTNPHALPPFPESILLNDAPSQSFKFVPGKTYKIRVISMAAFASVLLEFDSHKMKIVEIDGVYIKKTKVQQIRVAPAQRYTLLLKAKKNTTTNYAFTASLDINRDFAHDPAPVFPINATGYLVYDSAKALPRPYVVHSWTPADDFSFEPLDKMGLLGSPDKTIKLDFSFGLDSLGIPRTYFNSISYVSQKVPTLYTAISAGKLNTNPVIYGTINPFFVEKNQIVEIVVNNLDAAIHPFHLHGHQFQVCDRPASNVGSYTGSTKNFPKAPMRRDTVTVNAQSYAVLRFKADNPGIQLFHCHIEWHVIMGLTATIIESAKDLVGIQIPADHKAVCALQGIPTVGNAAGNSKNFTDLTGANTSPPNPDTGAIYSTTSRHRFKRDGPQLRSRFGPYV